MSDIIQVDDRKLRGLLKRIDPGQNKTLLKTPAHLSGQLLLERMQAYPAPISTSKYRRTNTLKRGWKNSNSATSDGWKVVVGNEVSYSKYVQREDSQARIHRNRWSTEAQVLRANLPDIRRIFVSEIDREINK